MEAIAHYRDRWVADLIRWRGGVGESQGHCPAGPAPQLAFAKP